MCPGASGQELGAEPIYLSMTVFCSNEAGLFMQNGATKLQRRRDDPRTPSHTTQKEKWKKDKWFIHLFSSVRFIYLFFNIFLHNREIYVYPAQYKTQ